MLVVVLAPWWRNHGLLRDFFDYGLMMVASGRMAEGGRPFVDFLTPLPSLSYFLNAWVEHWLGGTYQAMTLGNAGLMVVVSVGLGALLRRWFPGWAAWSVATTLVVGSFAQHAIIWYNTLGVVLLALIAWPAAVAPVLSRERWGMNLIVAVALVLSGLNKLNYHAIGLVIAWAWPLRAALVGRESWRRALSTVLVWGLFGTLVPVVLELMVNGASWEMWRYNLIEVTVRQRGGNLWALLTLRFYFEPMHDYYDAWLRPLGAILVGWLVVVTGLAWRGRSGLDRLLLLGAGALVVGGTGGLMATNHEIGYVAMAAGMVLLVGLWIGFDLKRDGWSAGLGLILPTLLLGMVFWHSAWLGQRTLFGFSQSPRETYRELSVEGGAFDYLKGTRIPPEMASDLESLAERLGPVEPGKVYPYFFGGGVEWLQRIWRTDVMSGLPILIAPLGYGPPELQVLGEALSYPSRFEAIVTMDSWMELPGDLDDYIRLVSTRERSGQYTIWRLHQSEVREGLAPREDAVQVLNTYGGNLDGRLITVEARVQTLKTHEGRSALGLVNGVGGFVFEAPTHQLKVKPFLRRLPDADESVEPKARFTVQALDAKTGALQGDVWTHTLVLPAGEKVVEVEQQVAMGGRATRFLIEVDDEAAGLAAAGWFLPKILQAAERSEEPPRLRAAAPMEEDGEERSWRERTFPADWVDDVELVVRGGTLTDDGILISRGGELWFRGLRRIEAWDSRIRAHPDNVPGHQPVYRLIWYEGGEWKCSRRRGCQSVRRTWACGAGVPSWTDGLDC